GFAVQGSFLPASDDQYVQSHDIQFTIDGVTPEVVRYVFSNDPRRPETAMAYLNEPVMESIEGAPLTETTYRIPADASLHGQSYIHVMAMEQDRYYYYSKAYYFDNTPPEVSFSINGVSYPLEEQKVK